MRATVILALMLAACGGDPSDGSDRADGRDTTSGGEGCAPDETPLGGGDCWSASSTRWRIEADGPGGMYRFEVSLLAAGRMRSTDHDTASPGHDEWFQRGPLLRLFLSDRFVEYRTRVTNGTVLVGEALNVRGQRWSWRGDRVFGETQCNPSEVRLDDGCMSVEGTSWELDGRVVQFLRAGVVALVDDDAAGLWEQAGSALRFTTTSAEQARAHVAELESSRRLSGGYDGGDGSWSASRIPSIPPVMHE